MSLLPETESAFREYASTQQLYSGQHESAQHKAGVNGRFVGEVDYNPFKHRGVLPSPYSVWEEVTGEEQVRMVIPNKAMDVHLVLHQPGSVSADNTFNLGSHRRFLANQLFEELDDVISSAGDRVFQYSVGEDALSVQSTDAEISETNGDPEEDAKQIAEICQQGLTVVLSDFLHLPLHQENMANFPSTLGVKVNVPYDLELPQSDTVIRTNIRGGEINFSNRKEVERVNALLKANHERIIRNLGLSGIAVASAIYSPDFYDGFDATQVDHQIAAAVEKLDEQNQ
jgi:hypothetical protein